MTGRQWTVGILTGGVLVLSGGPGVPSPAFAWFETGPAPESPVRGNVPKKPLLPRPGLRQFGAEGDIPEEEKTHLVQGFGHHVTFRDGRALLLGPGWTVRFHPGVTPATRIDWTGGSSLSQTLDRIARTANLAVRVDWRSRTIALFRARDGGHRLPELPKTGRPAPEGRK